MSKIPNKKIRQRLRPRNDDAKKTLTMRASLLNHLTLEELREECQTLQDVLGSIKVAVKDARDLSNDNGLFITSFNVAYKYSASEVAGVIMSLALSVYLCNVVRIDFNNGCLNFHRRGEVQEMPNGFIITFQR